MFLTSTFKPLNYCLSNNTKNTDVYLIFDITDDYEVAEIKKLVIY